MEARYSEIKQLKLPGIWVSYLFLAFIVIIALLAEPTRFSKNLWILVGALIYIGGMIILSKNLILNIEIDAKGVSYFYRPFIKRQVILKEQITALEIVKFDPVKIFLGWGIRKSKKFGRALTTDGSYGLRVSYNGNKTIILGINDMNKLKNYFQQVEVYNSVLRLNTLELA